MSRILAFFSVAPLLLVAACSGAPNSDGSDTTEDDLKTKTCGGVAGVTCSKGYSCEFPQGTAAYPDQTGTCKKNPTVHHCGGIAGLVCPSGLACSMPEGAVPDQQGTCVKDVTGQMCGGFAGIACPSGFACVMPKTAASAHPDASGTCQIK